MFFERNRQWFQLHSQLGMDRDRSQVDPHIVVTHMDDQVRDHPAPLPPSPVPMDKVPSSAAAAAVRR